MYQIQSVWGNTIDMPRMLKAVARALLFRGLAFSDVRVCVPLRRFAQFHGIACAGGGVLRVEVAAVYTQQHLIPILLRRKFRDENFVASFANML